MNFNNQKNNQNTDVFQDNQIPHVILETESAEDRTNIDASEEYHESEYFINAECPMESSEFNASEDNMGEVDCVQEIATDETVCSQYESTTEYPLELNVHEDVGYHEYNAVPLEERNQFDGSEYIEAENTPAVSRYPEQEFMVFAADGSLISHSLGCPDFGVTPQIIPADDAGEYVLQEIPPYQEHESVLAHESELASSNNMLITPHNYLKC